MKYTINKIYSHKRKNFSSLYAHITLASWNSMSSVRTSAQYSSKMSASVPHLTSYNPKEGRESHQSHAHGRQKKFSFLEIPKMSPCVSLVLLNRGRVCSLAMSQSFPMVGAKGSPDHTRHLPKDGLKVDQRKFGFLSLKKGGWVVVSKQLSVIKWKIYSVSESFFFLISII